MNVPIVDLREFYLNPLGRNVARLLSRHVDRLWPDVQGQTVVAVGYATPILSPWLDRVGALPVFMPAEQGGAYWPRDGLNRTCLVDLTEMPLPDESAHRVVALHALETASDPAAVLRELWRILKDDGHALLIVPNRRGIWAHSDRTPFGTGRPYSSFQLKAALREQGFLIGRSWRALYAPPSCAKTALALSNLMESGGKWLFPGLGGLLLMEARKQKCGAVLAKTAVPARRSDMAFLLCPTGHGGGV